MKKLISLACLIAVIGTAVFFYRAQSAYAFNSNNVIDDGIFDKANSMNASQIDSWLNSNFPSSCISTNHGFSAPDPTGYSPNPSQFFFSSSPVSAGQIIYDAAQAYSINPQVLLATLQKEESLVDGGAGCATWQYTSAMGYGCTDSGTSTHNYSYPGGGLVTPLYYINGSAVNSVSNSCVNSGPKAGFSEQVIHAAWLFTFSRHKAEGDTSWAVVKGNWDNCDDNNTCPATWNIPSSDACYGGFMTQGNFKRCPTDSAPTFYDGYATIDGSSVHMDTGATAAFYVYTPHFHGNQNFDTVFQSWFGSVFDVYSWSVVSQYAYTDQTKATPVDSRTLAPGQKIYIGFTAKNTGDTTWSNTGSSPLHVATTSPQDRNSVFCDSTWLSCNRPAVMKEASVAPGQTGTFEFWYKYNQQGTYDEHFSLVAEGYRWLNDPGLYFHTTAQPPIYSWSISGQNSYTNSSKTTPVDSSKLTSGQKIYLVITAQNTGNVSWLNSGSNPVHLGTSNPLDRDSVFCDSSWLSCNRPAGMDEGSVAPGATATFEFWYKAGRTGVFREYFRPVAEGYGWMNDTGLNYYTVVAFDTSGTTPILGQGQALTADQAIVSADGRYRLYMQTDGNLVLYSINRAVWSTNTAGKPVTRVVMQSDGNLVLYDAQNKPYWSSGTAGKGQSNLVMQSDGNLVLYNSSNRPTWASNTNGQI